LTIDDRVDGIEELMILGLMIVDCRLLVEKPLGLMIVDWMGLRN